MMNDVPAMQYPPVTDHWNTPMCTASSYTGQYSYSNAPFKMENAETIPSVNITSTTIIVYFKNKNLFGNVRYQQGYENFHTNSRLSSMIPPDGLVKVEPSMHSHTTPMQHKFNPLSPHGENSDHRVRPIRQHLYKCELCNKSFTKKPTLKLHMR
jgi:hypothetical protein